MKLAYSPLRYPGGKSKALTQILKHIPTNFKQMREPFVGGGSVFLALNALIPFASSKYWINDLNVDLIHFWTAVRDEPELLVSQVKIFYEAYDNGRELYNFLKDENNMRSSFDRAVRFFIMNRITFSGIMDSGGYSEQAYKQRFTLSSINRLYAVTSRLRRVIITNCDYEEVVTTQGEDVFIFLDPPYWSATGSKLYGVKGDLHTTFDHKRFASIMKGCNHRWLITYDNSEYIKSLFSFANITEWELQYGMNNYGQGKAEKGKELFISNY